MNVPQHTSGVYYASRSSTALELAGIMVEKNIGLLPIVQDSRVVGVVSERDLVAQIVATGKDPAQVKASEIMTPDPIVADVKESWDVILSKMKHINSRHMLLMSNGLLSGVLSLRDFLLANVDAKQTEMKKAYDAVYVDTSADKEPEPVDIDMWSCRACGFMSFGSSRPQNCPSCGLIGSFQGSGVEKPS